MRAEELRIGNLVTRGNKKHSFKIKEIHESSVVLEVYSRTLWNITIIEPIPLTEEWLVKLGFEYRDYYKNYRIMAGDYYNSVQLRDGKWLYNGDSSDAQCYGIREVQYVHTLQNLYHALNDEELTLNETI